MNPTMVNRCEEKPLLGNFGERKLSVIFKLHTERCNKNLSVRKPSGYANNEDTNIEAYKGQTNQLARLPIQQFPFSLSSLNVKRTKEREM